MELYLDSANLKEIEEGFKLGFLNGLTTTPTFMQKEGITDIDGTIVKLSKMVPVLQIEALGATAEEVLRQLRRAPQAPVAAPAAEPVPARRAWLLARGTRGTNGGAEASR